MTDDIAGLQHRLRQFAAERNWEQYHTPRNLSALIASEAGELLALFRWDEDSLPDRRADVEAELADVFLGVLRFADVAGIDLIEASRKKISANAHRYPAGPETPASAARDDHERLEGRIWHPPEGTADSARGGLSTEREDQAEPGCPFCDLASDRVTSSSTHARSLADAYPVTDGHTLVVPARHVASLFDLPADEMADVWRLVGEVRAALAASHDADAFTIGVNDGGAAGQTVGHAHVHVIPRRRGDVPDPRGGVRWVVPERAAYWERDR